MKQDHTPDTPCPGKQCDRCTDPYNPDEAGNEGGDVQRRNAVPQNAETLEEGSTGKNVGLTVIKLEEDGAYTRPPNSQEGQL